MGPVVSSESSFSKARCTLLENLEKTLAQRFEDTTIGVVKASIVVDFKCWPEKDSDDKWEGNTCYTLTCVTVQEFDGFVLLSFAMTRTFQPFCLFERSSLIHLSFFFNYLNVLLTLVKMPLV
jgi:hypothetical protein